MHHPLDTRAQVDLASPDLTTHPNLREARGTELTLHPGQCLFLPAYWWHEVLSTPSRVSRISAGITHFFRPFYLSSGRSDVYAVTNPFYAHLDDDQDTMWARVSAEGETFGG